MDLESHDVHDRNTIHFVMNYKEKEVSSIIKKLRERSLELGLTCDTGISDRNSMFGMRSKG